MGISHTNAKILEIANIVKSAKNQENANLLVFVKFLPFPSILPFPKIPSVTGLC
jgi:hypothetical protein